MAPLIRWARRIALPAAAILVASVGFGAGAGFTRHAIVSSEVNPNRYALRRLAIESQARQGRYDAVIFGDSIVEFAAIETLCGKRVLNAGVAGARIDDVRNLAPLVMRTVHPRLAIVAVGVNDAAKQLKTGASSFASSYEHLLRYLQSTGVSLHVATIAPIGEQMGGIGGPYDAGYASELNDEISALSREFSVSRIAFDQMPRQGSGALSPELTTDGIHLSAQGYAEWQRILSQHVCAPPAG